jgi:hypothetical protein
MPEHHAPHPPPKPRAELPRVHAGTYKSGASPRDVLEWVGSFYATEKIENARAAYEKWQSGPDQVRGDEPIIQAREAIVEALAEVIIDPANSQFTREFIRLRQSVMQATERITSLLSVISEKNLAAFLVNSQLAERFEKDHRKEKEAVARFVGDRFFGTDKEYCFIQASVTGIHLARELVKKIVGGSWFCTNSIAIPLVMLQECNNFTVYTLNGADCDPLCGGWLPRHDDDEAHSYLRELFKRDRNPLRKAIVTPIAATADKGELLYTRDQLLPVLKILHEHSHEMIVMTFTGRIYRNLTSARQAPELTNVALHAFRPAQWPLSSHQRPKMAVSFDQTDRRDEPERRKLLEVLRSQGFDVFWQKENKTDGWVPISGQ